MTPGMSRRNGVNMILADGSRHQVDSHQAEVWWDDACQTAAASALGD